VLLTLELTEQLLADDAIARTDSCATAGHPMIDRLWRERLPLVDRLIGLRPDAGLTVAKHLETSRRALIGAAKRVRGLIIRP
jgi:hypothetical protein